jgi:hypothetical protein
MRQRVRTILAFRAAGVLLVGLAIPDLVRAIVQFSMGIPAAFEAEPGGATGRLGQVLAEFSLLGIIVWLLNHPLTWLGIGAGVYLIRRDGWRLVRRVASGTGGRA